MHACPDCSGEVPTAADACPKCGLHVLPATPASGEGHDGIHWRWFCCVLFFIPVGMWIVMLVMKH